MTPSQNLQSAMHVAETMLEADYNAISWTAYRGALENLHRSLKAVMGSPDVENLVQLRGWLEERAALLAETNEPGDSENALWATNSALAITVAILHQNTLRDALERANKRFASILFPTPLVDDPTVIALARTGRDIINRALGDDETSTPPTPSLVAPPAASPSTINYTLHGPTDPALFARVCDIIGLHLDLDASEIKEDDEFYGNLRADSLDAVELLMAFEEEFNIEITDEEAEKVVTVGDAVRVLSGMVK